MRIPVREFDRLTGAFTAAENFRRQRWEQNWRQLADNFAPNLAVFDEQWERLAEITRWTKLLDNTPVRASGTLASGMIAGLTSPTRPWFRLVLPDPQKNLDVRVQRWLTSVERVLREVFARSNLYKMLPLAYRSLGVFGVTAMVIDADDDAVLRATWLPVGTFSITLGQNGEPDALHHTLRMSPAALVDAFGEKNVSSQVVSMANGTGAHTHAVTVCRTIRRSRLATGFPWESVYWEKGAVTGQVLEVRGYHERPFMAPRWDAVPQEPYGWGPANECLGDAKGLQLMHKRKAKGIAKHVDPPLLAPASMRHERISLLPGKINYSPDPINQPLGPLVKIQPDIQGLLLDIADTRQRIQQSMFTDLFRLLMNDNRNQRATAREIEELHEEKILGLGPVLERVNDELLDPLIDRAFALAWRAGLIEDPPDEVTEVRVEYISILTQAQKMLSTARTERLLGIAQALAATWPETGDVIDTEKAVRIIGDDLGSDPRVLRTADEVLALRRERQQQIEAEQRAQVAKTAADAARSGARAAADATRADQQGDVGSAEAINQLAQLVTGQA